MAIRNPFDRFDWFRKTTGPTFDRPGSISGNISGTVVESPSDGYEGRDWSGYLSELRDIYTKEGPATSAYREHLGNMPTYTPPGKMGRVVAALTGAAEGWQRGAGAGFSAAQGVIQSPYRQAMEEWGTKESALARQAQMEDASSGRRLGYMKEVREVAENEQQWRKYMQDYDLKVDEHERQSRYTDAQIANMQNQGFREHTDERGISWLVHPDGREIEIGPSAKRRDWAFQEDASKRGWAGVGIAGENARTARANLGMREKEFGLKESEFGLSQQRENRLATDDQDRPISPLDQSRARSSAYTRAILRNPDWQNYVDENGNINYRVASKYPQGFRDFMAAVEEEEESIFSRTRTPIIR